MSNDSPHRVPLMLALTLAVLDATQAYCSELERGTPRSLRSHDRAWSRALNTLNAQWFNQGLRVVASCRDAVQDARQAGLAGHWLSAADLVLAQQEASLRATARRVVHIAYAY